MAARRAKELGWCDEPYWGWTPELAARAAERLGPSNERFAQAVWGSPWPMPLARGPPACAGRAAALPPGELDRVHEFVIGMASAMRHCDLGAE